MRLLRLLFSCRHPRITFPITHVGAPGPTVTCHSCFRELPYDWEAMRIKEEPCGTLASTAV